jgi:hypothetical protein
LSGCIIRQLYHGTPYFVFVQHARGNQPRAVARVARNGSGWKVKGPRIQFQSNETEDAMVLCAEYLQETRGRFA